LKVENRSVADKGAKTAC